MALGKPSTWKNFDKFKDGPPTFSLRHPDLKGPYLRKQFDADYVEFTCHHNVPLFHKGGPRNGQPVFKRHPDNKRKQRAVIKAYAKYFLENGWVKDGRSGKVMGIPDTMDQESWEIFQLSAATLLE